MCSVVEYLPTCVICGANPERTEARAGGPHLYNTLPGLSQQLVFKFFGHLHVEELLQSSLNGHSALPVPFLHLVAEFIPVVKLLDLLKICLVIAIPEERHKALVL